MQVIRAIIKGILATLCIEISCHAYPTTVTIINEEGQNTELEIQENDKFSDVLDWIQLYCQNSSTDYYASNETSLDLNISEGNVVVSSKRNVKGRNYYAPLTKKEQKDISYIITTVAWDSLISIGASESSLKKAGNRINHIHPLRFLTFALKDEKLKAGLHAIRDRIGWVSNEFFDGICKSFKEESLNNNLKVEYIQDTAKTLNVDFNAFNSLLQQSRWRDAINFLIDSIPRENDPNRYRM